MTAHDDERRGHVRYAILNTIKYTDEQGGSAGRMIDISEGGIKFQTEDLMDPMQNISVILHGNEEMPLPGVSIWSSRIDSRNVAAILFKDLSPEQQTFLRDFISETAEME